MSKSVKLIECFQSYQGEGPNSGMAMIILRFKTCNLHCPWCDTSVKMRISMEAPYELVEIQKQIYETKSGILVTGGEPTVKRHFNDAVTLLNELDYPIANLESNGYKLFELIEQIDPTKPINYIYSPKIFDVNDLNIATENTKKLFEKFSDKVFIKVVYEDRTVLLNYLDWLTKEINKVGMYDKVWLMPEGTNRADLIKNSSAVIDACEKYRFNFSTRTHVIFGFI